MTQNCLTNDPVDQIEIYFGFFVFTLFLGFIIICHMNSVTMESMKKKAKEYRGIEMKQEKKKFKYAFNQEEKQGLDYERTLPRQQQKNQMQTDGLQIQKHHDMDQQETIPYYQKADTAQPLLNSKILSKIRKPEETWKKFSQYAYRYPALEHEVLKIYRSPAQILEEREPYINRIEKGISTKQKQISKAVKKQGEQEQGKAEIKATTFPKSSSFTNIKNAKQIQNQNKPAKVEEQKTVKPATCIVNLPNLKQTAQSQPVSNLNLPKPTPQPTIGLFAPVKQQTALIQQTKKQQPTKQKQQNLIQPIIPSKEYKQKQQKKENLFAHATIQPQKKQKEQPKQEKKEVQQMKMDERTQPIRPEALQIKSSADYLEAIIKYAETFTIKTQIKTNINNLSGAKSDPRDLWAFATSYIKTINPNNYNEAVTFSSKIFEAIVHKFIKNTNIKDGYQKIPPKEKSGQVEKNSINTYVLLINIFRTMGHQIIWLGIFGKILKMLDFLYKRQQPVKDWKQLELIQAKYVLLDGDVSAKYQSRIDFLIYFLLALTTFDPIQFFEEVAQKTGQVYPFIPDLKRNKYKWSYREFWCLVEVMRKNKLNTYFKIPFWNNALTIIYLQMLKNLKQGQMREFMILSKWIFQQVRHLVAKLSQGEEWKALYDANEQGPNGKYTFEGEQFLQGTKTWGRMMESKLRTFNTTKWQQFRDNNSIFYYFWRKN